MWSNSNLIFFFSKKYHSLCSYLSSWYSWFSYLSMYTWSRGVITDIGGNWLTEDMYFLLRNLHLQLVHKNSHGTLTMKLWSVGRMFILSYGLYLGRCVIFKFWSVDFYLVMPWREVNNESLKPINGGYVCILQSQEVLLGRVDTTGHRDKRILGMGFES